MWTGTTLILAVILVPMVAAVMDRPSVGAVTYQSSGLLCDVNSLDPVDVPKILKGTVFAAVSTHGRRGTSGIVIRYEQKDPNTLIVKKRRYIIKNSSPECRPGITFSPNITEHGFQRKSYRILIIAYSDNHIALLYEKKKRVANGILLIYARNFRRPLKMTDIDSAMLQKIKERCGENATRLDFYARRYEPLPTTENNCLVF